MGTVLLADDSQTIRKVIELSFAGENIRIESFLDGQSAYDFLAENLVDVVLADVTMPGLDGYALCERIKSTPALKHIPVVLLAGTLEPFDAERAQTVGYHSSLTKPFETSELVRLVKQLLRSAPASAQARPSGGDGKAVSVRVNQVISQTSNQKEVSKVDKKNLFSLTPSQCHARPSFVDDYASPEALPVNETPSPDPVIEGNAAPVTLSQQQIDAVVEKVAARLPGELRRILTEVLQETSAVN